MGTKVGQTKYSLVEREQREAMAFSHSCNKRRFYPDVDKGEAGKVESSKEGEEWSIEDRHHCVTAGEGSLNILNNKSEKKRQNLVGFSSLTLQMITIQIVKLFTLTCNTFPLLWSRRPHCMCTWISLTEIIQQASQVNLYLAFSDPNLTFFNCSF